MKLCLSVRRKVEQMQGTAASSKSVSNSVSVTERVSLDKAWSDIDIAQLFLSYQSPTHKPTLNCILLQREEAYQNKDVLCQSRHVLRRVPPFMSTTYKKKEEQTKQPTNVSKLTSLPCIPYQLVLVVVVTRNRTRNL